MKKKLIWRYFLSKRIFSLFLFVSASIMPIAGTASENVIWIGFFIVLFFFFCFDFFSMKTFCKIIIEKDKLFYKRGGAFWKLIPRESEFSWEQYNFKAYYCWRDYEKHYSRLYIFDNKGKRHLCLKSQFVRDFEKLIEAIAEYNPYLRLIDLNKVAEDEGFISMLFK